MASLNGQNLNFPFAFAIGQLVWQASCPSARPASRQSVCLSNLSGRQANEPELGQLPVQLLNIEQQRLACQSSALLPAICLSICRFK